MHKFDFILFDLFIYFPQNSQKNNCTNSILIFPISIYLFIFIYFPSILYVCVELILILFIFSEEFEMWGLFCKVFGYVGKEKIWHWRRAFGY